MEQQNNVDNLLTNPANPEAPLVSIIVITYNSAKYVVETLESAKAQTYRDIELIISDDCSSDDTVEICKNWMTDNLERFVRTELITFDHNTGISSNCNRGLTAAKGEWVKFIAGDDVLLDKCIGLNINYVKKHSEIEVLHSDVILKYDHCKAEAKNSSDRTKILFS